MFWFSWKDQQQSQKLIKLVEQDWEVRQVRPQEKVHCRYCKRLGQWQIAGAKVQILLIPKDAGLEAFVEVNEPRA